MDSFLGVKEKKTEIRLSSSMKVVIVEIDTSYLNKKLASSNKYDFLLFNSYLITMVPYQERYNKIFYKEKNEI